LRRGRWGDRVLTGDGRRRWGGEKGLARRRSKAVAELQWPGKLEEGTGEVRRGPKGANEGGTGELNEGERNGGAAAQRRRGSGDGGGPVRRAQTQGRREKGRRVMGCSGVLASEDESGKKGGGGGEAPFIADVAGVGDGPWAAPHDSEARGWRGASVAVGRHSVAGSGLATALVGAS
jgi:hypothetical protein